MMMEEEKGGSRKKIWQKQAVDKRGPLAWIGPQFTSSYGGVAPQKMTAAQDLPSGCTSNLASRLTAHVR